MAMMTMALFTSCDREFWEDMEDRHEASTLDGTWTGYIDTYYYDRWGLTGDSYRTTMYFEREDSKGGWGYEVDYDLNSRYDDYYYSEFTWKVCNGTICLHYKDSWNDVYIRDYHLDNNYFEGYMDDGTSKDIVFQLSYDYHFDWNKWGTRGASGNSSVIASGKFAKK